MKSRPIDQRRALCDKASDAAALDCITLSSVAESRHSSVSGFPKSYENAGAMSLSIVEAHVIWRETDRRLDSLSAQVREGVAVDEASNFGRWLSFSGVIKVLEACEHGKPLPVRGAELRAKCEALISDCGDWYAKHERSNVPRDAYVSRSKLEALEREVQRMAGELRRLSPPLPKVDTAHLRETGEPELRVIRGGRSA